MLLWFRPLIIWTITLKGRLTMAWNESGEDRAKRFRVYKELLAKYEALRSERDILASVVNRKDELIRQLAAELSQERATNPADAPDAPETEPTEEEASKLEKDLKASVEAVQELQRAHRTASGTMTKPTLADMFNRPNVAKTRKR